MPESIKNFAGIKLEDVVWIRPHHEKNELDHLYGIYLFAQVLINASPAPSVFFCATDVHNHVLIYRADIYVYTDTVLLCIIYKDIVSFFFFKFFFLTSAVQTFIFLMRAALPTTDDLKNGVFCFFFFKSLFPWKRHVIKLCPARAP